jgi:hypothetical protein
MGATGPGLLELLLPQPIPDSQPPAFTSVLSPDCLLAFARRRFLGKGKGVESKLYLTTALNLTDVLSRNLSRELFLRDITESAILSIVASSKDKKSAIEFAKQLLGLLEECPDWGEGRELTSEDEFQAERVVFELGKMSQARVGMSLLQQQQEEDRLRREMRVSSTGEELSVCEEPEQGEGGGNKKRGGQKREVAIRVFNPLPKNERSDLWKASSTHLDHLLSSKRSEDDGDDDDEQPEIVRTLRHNNTRQHQDATFLPVDASVFSALNSIRPNHQQPDRLYSASFPTSSLSATRLDVSPSFTCVDPSTSSTQPSAKAGPSHRLPPKSTDSRLHPPAAPSLSTESSKEERSAARVRYRRLLQLGGFQLSICS